LPRPRELYQALRGNSRGITLIEVLIALAILGFVAVAFLSALATASTAILVADERTTAESLARSELEYVKSQPFSTPCPTHPWSYQASSTTSQSPSPHEPSTTAPTWWAGHTLPSEYGCYSVIVTGQVYVIDGSPKEGIWEVTVKVYHNGTPNPDDLVLTTRTYKVRR
jgi:prepilin-type N-terminal cleavage/methylation domain-containing protein